MLLVAFLLVTAPNCHLSLVLASVVQDDAVNCNKSEVSDGSLLLLVAFLLVTAPNCHHSLVLDSVVQGDAVNCNKWRPIRDLRERS